MSRAVLVVSPDDIKLADTLRVLSGAGYESRGATTFEGAAKSLAGNDFDCIITDQRLGEFNGLHLILRGRSRHPEMRGIVTTSIEDPCLEVEAQSLNAEYVVKPGNPADWLAFMSQPLGPQRPS